MEDVEMSQVPSLDRQQTALQQLVAARVAFEKLPAGNEQIQAMLYHATQALRLADNNRWIKATASLILGYCHERQDKWNTAYYEYKAAKEHCPRVWTQAEEQALQYCHCKIFPR